MKRKILYNFLITLIVIMIGFVSRTHQKNDNDNSVNTLSKYSSKATIVLDSLNNEILYENNIHQKMLPASLTKVLTAYVCLKYYSLDDYVIITHEMVNVEGSKIYLKVGNIISVEDLLYGLLMYSGNDAAMALAMHYSGNINDFIILMNECCQELKMNNSIFFNPHGLDTINENLTTAYDLAILFSACLKNETFRTIIKTTHYKTNIYSGEFYSFRNKHRLLHSCPNATGGKTGVAPILCEI